MIDKDYLLTKINIEAILEIMSEFGAEPHQIKADKEIWFNTICHDGDSHKLCYFIETHTFFCYTNCGQMSIFTFIMQMLQCTFSDSLIYLANKLRVNTRTGFHKNNNYLATAKKEIQQIDKYILLRRKKIKTIENLPCVQTKILNYFENDMFYIGWIEEGISIETMIHFNILWYEIGKHIIIPHTNAEGELIGIRRRSLIEQEQKYMPVHLEGILYNHSLNLNFYGLYEHMRGIKKFKKVVIVESEKSVLLAYEYYGEDAFVIATCGFNISNWHKDLILNLGVEEVMLAFDKDFDITSFEEGNNPSQENKRFEMHIQRLYSLAHKFSAFCRTYIIWDRYNCLNIKDSPFDRGKETLEFLMKHKIEINTNREEVE